MPPGNKLRLFRYADIDKNSTSHVLLRVERGENRLKVGRFQLFLDLKES